MKKGFEYQFTISTSNKRKNFAVPYRQTSTFSQSVESGPISNYKLLLANTFTKSTEEDQFNDFITSKRSAFDIPICFTETTLSLLDKPLSKRLMKTSTTLSLIDEVDFISAKTIQSNSEFYEESKLSKGFDSESDT